MFNINKPINTPTVCLNINILMEHERPEFVNLTYTNFPESHYAQHIYPPTISPGIFKLQ